ncbi:hypothetical protein PG996_011941 [Apiospora saccharicola]|uniref:Uncharacterized protein n=1 Tax=Apiospora saccharicola TaxID=335842 RepID=A0ABR1U3H9_9PEZI
MTVGLPVPPGFVSTATITTTTAATAAAATSDKDVSGGGSKSNSGDQGLSPAAVVGISIAIHIVVTIILVLFVRAYRNKYKRLKKAQQQQQAAVLGERRRGGACGRQPPVKKRASPQKWFKRVSNHHSGNIMTQDTTWIKLQDNVAATSSDAWSSPREARHSASDRTTSLPPPAVLPHPSTPITTTTATTQNRNINNNNNTATAPNRGIPAAPGGLNISNPTGAGPQLPSYRTSRSSDTYNFFGRAARVVNGADASEEPPAHSTVWNDARWNEVLYRTLQEPPRSETASLCQASARSLGGGEGGRPPPTTATTRTTTTIFTYRLLRPRPRPRSCCGRCIRDGG